MIKYICKRSIKKHDIKSRKILYFIWLTLLDFLILIVMLAVMLTKNVRDRWKAWYFSLGLSSYSPTIFDMTLEILYTFYIHQYLNRAIVKGFTLILVIKGGKLFANRDLPSLHCRRKLIPVAAVTFSKDNGISTARIPVAHYYGYYYYYHRTRQPRLKSRMSIVSHLLMRICSILNDTFIMSITMTAGFNRNLN